MRNSIIAYGIGGGAAGILTGTITLSCCDIYGNEGGDWTGSIAGQLGVDGNICEDPIFCDAPVDDFCLQPESPCAPFSPPNEGCDLIGAHGVGCSGISSAEDPSELLVPRTVALGPGIPNPTAGRTSVTYTIPRSSRMTLGIFDVSGRLVHSLVDGWREAGTHTIEWSGDTHTGGRARPGVYLFRLQMADAAMSRRIAVLR